MDDRDQFFAPYLEILVCSITHGHSSVARAKRGADAALLETRIAVALLVAPAGWWKDPSPEAFGRAHRRSQHRTSSVVPVSD